LYRPRTRLVQTRTHRRVGLIDVGRGRIDAEFLAFLDLHLFIDQFIDHVLPDRGLVGGQGGQLHALLDIVIGDRLAVDHHGDGLRLRRRAAPEQDQRRGTTQEKRGEPVSARGGRHDHLRCINPIQSSNPRRGTGPYDGDKTGLLNDAAAGR
jgi:hypothetical protein